jgi:histidinol-phosphate aminotransferase
MEKLLKLMRPNILRMKAYSSARHEFEGVAECFLDANENPFDNGLNRYPDPLQHQLKERIAEIKKIDSNRIFLGNGSDEAIDLLFRIFCVPGKDNVIVLPPTYGMYQVAADIADVQIKEVPLDAEFQPVYEQIEKAVDTNTKIIFFCSPNNPTGNSIKPEIMEQVLEFFPGPVVVDEAYIDFSTQTSFLSLLDKYPNLLVMQTLSKAWGLAGIRLGMAFASPELITFFNKVKAPYNINQLTQEKALKMLEDTEKTAANVKTILQERERLEKVFANYSFIQKIYPSDANFILLKVDDANDLYKYLLSGKTVVRNRSTVPGCEGCLRITVGTPVENTYLIGLLNNYADLKTK